MMELICSGFGGQGVLTLGLIIAEIAAEQDKHVTWIPAYGSEMRGGAVSCTMKIGDAEIISPYVEEANMLVALSQEAFDKHKERVRPGGCIIVNSSIAKDCKVDQEATLIYIPAGEIAAAAENPKGMGLAIAGAVFAYSGMISKEAGANGVDAYFARKSITNPKNRLVFIHGYEAAEQHMAGGAM